MRTHIALHIPLHIPLYIAVSPRVVDVTNDGVVGRAAVTRAGLGACSIDRDDVVLLPRTVDILVFTSSERTVR